LAKEKATEKHRKIEANRQEELDESNRAAKEQNQQQEEIYFFAGKIVELSQDEKILDITHKLIINDRVSYYLRGSKPIINQFINVPVSVNGMLQKDSRVPGKRGVLTAMNIQLVLEPPAITNDRRDD